MIESAKWVIEKRKTTQDQDDIFFPPSIVILLLRSTQASAPRSILRLSLKALWAKIKGTYYHWDTTTGPNIKGNVLGVDIEITPLKLAHWYSKPRLRRLYLDLDS
jgi:hypothetical protein